MHILRRVGRALVVSLLTVASGTVHAQPAAPAAADLVIRGGRIFTADSANPWAEALAVRGDRIVFVGSTAAAQRFVSRRTRVIDVAGRVVIPGINDAHDHLGGDTPPGVVVRTSLSPTPNESFAVIRDSVRAAVRAAAPGQWITALIGVTALNDPSARRAALDSVAPAHPVMLFAWWGHGVILNSAALARLGLTGQEPDPLGGWLERDAAGRGTGRLDEYAGWDALRRLYSTIAVRDVATGLTQMSGDGLAFGVTSIQDMAGYLTPSATIASFRRAALAQRVRIIRWPMPDATGLRAREWENVADDVAPRVRVSGMKWVLDATPIDQFALRRRAYPGRPDWFGRLNFDADTMRVMLAAALRPGAPQTHLHITGDSTLLRVLDMMQALAPDDVWRTKRLRIEHANGIVGPAMARARALGIVIGQPRQNSAPLRSWLSAGIPVAYGSDGLRNPFVHLAAWIAPTNDPAEAITREQGVVVLTRHAAFAEFEELRKGTLAAGFLADFAVLSQDIFTVPAQALPGTQSLLTVIGGRVALDRLQPPASR